MRKRRRKMKITMKRNNVLMGTAALLIFTMLSVPEVYAADCEASGTLKLRVTQYHLVLMPKIPVCVAVSAGVEGKFKITILPVGGSGSAVNLKDADVWEKHDSSPVTIRGGNDSVSNQIDVVVTLKTGRVIEVGNEFEFWITIKDVGKLDPRVRVKDADLLQKMHYELANEMMIVEFGSSIDEMYLRKSE
jgi:hypothetical protein